MGFFKHDVVVLSRRSNDRRPAVAGALSVMDDQRRDGTLSRRFFELVDPAPVVGHAPIAEAASDRLPSLRIEVGIVDQVHRDLAAQVDLLVVVPLAFRRGDSVADEHDRRRLDRDTVDLSNRADVDVVALCQRAFFSFGREAQRRRRTNLRANERNRLRPGPTFAAGLESQLSEAIGEPFDGLGFARRSGRAAFELVRGQHFDRLRDALGIDRAGSFCCEHSADAK